MRLIDGGTFFWRDYPPQVHGAIALAWEQSKRLTRCSLCGKPRISAGVAVPPVLKSAVPTDLRPKPYALCKVHDAWSIEAVADGLYGPIWRDHDEP